MVFIQPIQYFREYIMIFRRRDTGATSGAFGGAIDGPDDIDMDLEVAHPHALALKAAQVEEADRVAAAVDQEAQDAKTVAAMEALQKEM